MKSEELIQNSIEKTKQILHKASLLNNLPEDKLIWRPNENAWNIVECIEHLNLYGEFYINEIELAVLNTKFQNTTMFKSGWIGNYFAKSMLPKEKVNKMKTFKNKNPLKRSLNKQKVFNAFIHQQEKLIVLLNKSKNVNLNRVKVKTTISSLIKLNLGDTFQFVINHNIRHLKQIEQIQKQLQ